MNNVKIEKDKLIIEVPLFQERFDVWDEKRTWRGENIIGIIEPVANCNIPNCGFAYRIDMSYKDKADQFTDIFYHWHNDKEDFKKFCKENDIEVYEFQQCSSCSNAIYGPFTWVEKGKYLCSNCQDLLDENPLKSQTNEK